MRLISIFLLIAALFVLAACQDQQQAAPTAAAGGEASKQDAAGSEGAATAEPRKGEVIDVSREDAEALLNGRMLLTVFLNQTEGIPAPLAEQWKLEKVEAVDEGRRSFTFSSGEWLLKLQEPGPDDAGVLYRAQISGPDLANYTADIRADGSVAPAQ